MALRCDFFARFFDPRLYLPVGIGLHSIQMRPLRRKTYPNLDLEKAREQVCAAIKRAIDEVGTQKEFHRRLNEELAKVGGFTITIPAVQWWKTEGTFLDEVYWPIIERLSDMATTRRHLRPDIYGLGQP